MPVNSSAELKQRIADLEIKRDRQRAEIATTFQGMVETIKPKNLVKAGLQSISETPVLRQNFINAVVSLSTGWIARRLAVPKNDTIVKKTVGAAVQYGVSHLLATQGDALGEVMDKFMQNFKHRR